MARKSNYDKSPCVQVPEGEGACSCGWPAIGTRLTEAVRAQGACRTIFAVECYTGVNEQQVMSELTRALRPTESIYASDAMLSVGEIDRLVDPFLGGDEPAFCCICGFELQPSLDRGTLC